MAASADVGVLGNDHVVAQGDVVEVIQIDVGAHPGVVADGQLPRPLDTDPVTHQYPIAELGAERAQDCYARAVGAPDAGEDGALHGHPQGLPEDSATLIVGPPQTRCQRAFGDRNRHIDNVSR